MPEVILEPLASNRPMKLFGEHALAGAGLAHDGADFALVDVEIDVPDGVQLFAAEVELMFRLKFDRNDQFSFFSIFCPSLLQMVLRVGGVRRRRCRR